MINEASCKAAPAYIGSECATRPSGCFMEASHGPTIVADYPEYTILRFTQKGRPQITIGVSSCLFVEQRLRNSLLPRFMSTEIVKYSES